MTRTKLLLLILSAALALLPLSGAGQAGCRSVAVHHGRQQLVVDYVQSYPPQTYYVGQQLQLNAQEDRLAQKTAKLVLEQLRAQALQAPAEATQQPERLPLTAEDQFSLVRQFCTGCHGTNTKAAEAFDMSDLASLTCEQRVQMATSVLDGRMPKGKKIPPEVMGNLLGQILGADTAPNAGVKPRPAPRVEQLESPPVPEWKFQKGDIVTFDLEGRTLCGTVIGHHKTDKNTSYTILFGPGTEDSDSVQYEIAEHRLQFASPARPLSTAAEAMPERWESKTEDAPPQPEPNQESEVIQ